jgi:hypothetical protein
MPDLRLIVPDCRDSTVALLFPYNVLEAPTARVYSLFICFTDLVLCWLWRAFPIFLDCPFYGRLFRIGCSQQNMLEIHYPYASINSSQRTRRT